MIKTKIYTSRKLEKVSKEFVSDCKGVENEYLGDWAATLFYVSHKKCWLIINKLTKYFLILPDIKKADLKNISEIFKETFYSQLIYDGILIDYKLLEKIVGDIKLCETNNDRSATGSLNNALLYFEDWKYEFGDYENMPFRDLNNRLNSYPNQMLGWKAPKVIMAEMIKTYEQQSM